MEGYTARDALVVMRLDLAESLATLEEEMAELEETLEFAGIAADMLREDGSLTRFPAIRRWLETVSNTSDLRRDLEETRQERDEVRAALTHIEERLTGKGRYES